VSASNSDTARPELWTLPRPLRLLLIEDDPDQAELMTAVLLDHFTDANITVASSGEEVFNLDLSAYDVGLCDLHLPDCTGLDLLPHLRSVSDLPVIMITGERFGPTAADAIRKGAMDYIVKQGDYAAIVPAVIEKTLAMAEIKRSNRRLEQELIQRNVELERLNEQLREMATIDPLTRLYNRRHFAELLEQLFSESVRYGSDLTCMMADLDNFKYVNDTRGHPMGDRLLHLTADVLRAILRKSDLPARYGGDEFVVLFPRTAPADAKASARRFVDALRRELRLKLPQAPPVTVSVGLASREHGQPTTGDALIRLADQALYLAKQAGKDRIMAVSPLEIETISESSPVVA
jgi:two-component system cell cycle response regulator